jgi:hypothetical protein
MTWPFLQLKDRRMSNLLESPGYFWWGDTKTASGQLAPDSAIPGDLVIDALGVTKLSLNGMLTDDADGLLSVLGPSRPLPVDTYIHGILKSEGQRVLLGSIRRNGATLSGVGISHESFIADDCLVSSGSDPADVGANGYSTLAADVSILDEWLGVRAIEVVSRKTGFSASYRKPRDIVYQSDGGRLTIFHTAEPAHVLTNQLVGRKLDIRHKSAIKLSRRTSLGLSSHREAFQNLEDFFLLLVGEPVWLDWPHLSKGKRSARYYFRRRDTSKKVIRWFDCWTSFGQVKDEFGALFDGFRRKKDELGPALYLYLGVARASQLPLENRFATLIWGLEAMHRRVGATADMQAMQEKIQRILADISREKDRKWLGNRLKGAVEPPLQQRLYETFSSLSLGFECLALREFCQKCADRRNDISHFGGQRQGSYESFIAQVIDLYEAIEVMYHALLLKGIGVGDKVIARWIFNSPDAYRHKRIFEKAGLKPM